MKSFVINLHDRLDRWQVAEPHLKSHGFNVERYIGQRKPKGYEGCTASHLGALASAGEAPFIIFEDDVEIIGDVDVMHKAISELGDFDMLYLGCSPQETMYRHTEHTVALGRAYQTHAIVYGSNRVVDHILYYRHDIRKIDVFLSEDIHPYFNCFATNPMIARQRESYSDITRKVVSHSDIIEQFNGMIV